MTVYEIIKEMTLEEKAAIVAGTDNMYTNPIPRLGIESVRMSDGPHGLRVEKLGSFADTSDSLPATCFPTSVTLASSFNPENAIAVGRAIGKEAEHYGIDVVLGPGVNIKRNPLAGRNFEYFSEDPLVAGRMGTELIKGIQENGTGVAVKHFALNNSENFRLMGDSVCDMRAVREIYLKAFEMIIKEARPETVMCAYNKVNGTFASQNKWLLTDVLRKEWGFDGLVMTDWGATHDRLAMLRAGLDLEMPGDTEICRKWIVDGVREGKLAEETLDKAVANVLTLVANHEGRVKKNSDFDAHYALARRVAEDGAVLMKNNGALPLSKDGEYLVIGELFEKSRYQGSGSSLINPARLVTPKESFDSNGVKYEYVKGYRENEIKPDGALISEALAAAEKYESVLLFAGLTDNVESEGCDRENMRLPDNQLALINSLIENKKKIILVTYAGSPFEMPFEGGVDAILNMYLPGEGSGDATYSLLFGDTCPSGRLAESWPMSYGDVPFGEKFSKDITEVYYESVFVGYRYYASHKAGVRYPFGYGLSYTDFEYSDMTVEKRDDGVSVFVTVENTGRCRGGEVVQLYSSKKDSPVFRPERELRAFKKVYLEPNEATRVELFLPFDALKYWDIAQDRFVLEGGEYTLEICRDSLSPILSLDVSGDGESVPSPYTDRVSAIYSSLDPAKVDDSVFEEMSRLSIPASVPKKPIHMESRFTDLRLTFIGKILYGAVISIPKKDLRKAKALPEGSYRDNQIKGAIFKRRAMDSGSLTTMSMCAGKQFPYNFAEGFMHLSNGRLIKGASCFLKKINAPKLPKETK